MIRVDISGLNEVIKDLDMTNDKISIGTRNGLIKSSVYLRDKIKDRFGNYQSTGGGGGPWKKLQYKTVVRKRKKGYGTTANRPLIKTGKMKESIKSVINKSGKEAAIMSDDPKLKYHIFGAPRKGVPKRDPVLITTKEEQENVVHIFEEELLNEVFKDL